MAAERKLRSNVYYLFSNFFKLRHAQQDTQYYVLGKIKLRRMWNKYYVKTQDFHRYF